MAINNTDIQIRFVDNIADVAASQWNALLKEDYPFLRHEFLLALEQSGSINPHVGWQPCHALVLQDTHLLAAMPLYLKSHSYGEFVFDHIWQEAFSRHGINYYPKLVSAIPFTPVRGPRYLITSKPTKQDLVALLCTEIKKFVQLNNLSSWHILFPHQDCLDSLKQHNLLVRRSINFFWRNVDYDNFESFLARCNSRKRKNIRKERKHIEQAGITIQQKDGADISPEQWQFFYQCYKATYIKRSGHKGYLNQTFFETIAKTMSQYIVMFLATRNNTLVAASLTLRSDTTLYGRYWGCIEEIDKLHFEMCYYQGMNYCIKHKLKSFDGGVQGEHKLIRGFEPEATYSCHHISNPEFADAIEKFLEQETQYMESYKKEINQFLPFKKD